MTPRCGVRYDVNNFAAIKLQYDRFLATRSERLRHARHSIQLFFLTGDDRDQTIPDSRDRRSPYFHDPRSCRPRSVSAADEVDLIVNKANTIADLSLADAKKIFMGDKTTWPSGKRVSVLMAARRLSRTRHRPP